MGGYVKITFEDIEIAKNFFENDKHLDEFLVNVCKYYCGYENVFKYKNVKKFFETYKKTMDRVILGRSTGSIGGRKRVENQQDTSNTLEGVLEGGIKDPVKPKLIKEKKERKKRNIEFTPPSFDDVLSYFKEKGYTKETANKAFDYYEAMNWYDSKGNPVKNWKGKMVSVWFKDENKVTPEQERKVLRLPQEYENYMGMELGILLSRVKSQKGVEYIPDITQAQFDSLPRDSFHMYETLIKNGNCKIIEE